jgi:hypothetical protein
MVDISSLAATYARVGVSGDAIRRHAGRPAFIELFAGNAHLCHAMAVQLGERCHSKVPTILSVDNDERRSPKLLADVTNPEAMAGAEGFVESQMKQGLLVIGHASPPCSMFSRLRTKTTPMDAELLRTAIEIACAGLRFLDQHTCGLYTVENPATGTFWTQVTAAPAHRHNVDYCQYGWSMKKQTTIAFSTAELHNAFTPMVMTCPGSACKSAFVNPKTNRVRHQSIVTLPYQQRIMIPQQLANCMVTVLRQESKRIALQLADALDSIGSSRNVRRKVTVEYVDLVGDDASDLSSDVVDEASKSHGPAETGLATRMVSSVTEDGVISESDSDKGGVSDVISNSVSESELQSEGAPAMVIAPAPEDALVARFTQYSKTGEFLHNDIRLAPCGCGRLELSCLDMGLARMVYPLSDVLIGFADMRCLQPGEYTLMTPTLWTLTVLEVNRLLCEAPDQLLFACIPTWDYWHVPKSIDQYAFLRFVPANPGNDGMTMELLLPKRSGTRSSSLSHLAVEPARLADYNDYLIEGVVRVSTDVREYMTVGEVAASGKPAARVLDAIRKYGSMMGCCLPSCPVPTRLRQTPLIDRKETKHSVDCVD